MAGEEIGGGPAPADGDGAEAGAGRTAPAEAGVDARSTGGRGVMSTPAFKFFAVAFLVALLTVPLLFVWILADERSSRRGVVLASIDRDWGGAQVVRGPYLVVPVVFVSRTETDGRVSVQETVQDVVVFPDTMDAVVEARAESRSVSIFEAPVYNADVALKGRFPDLRESFSGGDVARARWDDARIVVELAGLTGIETARFSVSGAASPRALSVEPGGGYAGAGSVVAISATLDDAGLAAGGFGYEVVLGIRGRDTLDLLPAGRETTVSMSSDWRHPSFVGRLLPSSHEIDDAGFRASWTVPYLSRSFPQVVNSSSIMAEMRYGAAERVGVRLDEPVDHYALVERALKYGVMFVAAVFGIVFVLEILSKERIHPVQYVLVGLIVVFFYVLLLALAEHVGFAAAYAAAAAATSGVIATFVGLALASRRRGAVAGGGLAILFGLLFAILRLEDVALLAGAVAGFVALSAVLFATRRVDWSGRAAAPAAPAG